MVVDQLTEIANALLDIGLSIEDVAERLNLEIEHIEASIPAGIQNEEAKA
jgi:hypothetical protein|tara:strand:+ start:193 stop:342 length:150 start_codon:yes stop_codon:yes gene_type:complete